MITSFYNFFNFILSFLWEYLLLERKNCWGKNATERFFFKLVVTCFFNFTKKLKKWITLERSFSEKKFSGKFYFCFLNFFSGSSNPSEGLVAEWPSASLSTLEWSWVLIQVFLTYLNLNMGKGLTMVQWGIFKHFNESRHPTFDAIVGVV